MRRSILLMRYLCVAILLALATTACRDDVMRDYFPEEELTKETELKEDVEVDAFITLNVPHMMGVQPGVTSTRALTGEQEKLAQDIKILAFLVPDYTDEAQEKLSYEPRILSKPTLNPTTGVYQVKVRLKTKAQRQRLVILANYPVSTLTEGTTKEEVYKSMQTDYLQWKVDGEKSGATAGTDYDLLPMWGESDTQLITESSMKITFGDFQSGMPLQNTIYLYRSLARVDVGLAFQDSMTDDNTSGETPKLDAEGVKDFQLKSVRIYRYNSKYQIPGSQAAFGTLGSSSTKVITSPRVPEGSTLKGTDAALVYQIDDNSGKLVRSIYIPESRKPTSAKTGDAKDAELRDNATCIVIGGIYTGKVGNTVQSGNTKETYYRVDFLEGGHQTAPGTTQEKKYMDILRNHRYRINITKVGGPGFDTPEEALKHNDYSIFYTVSVWNNADLSRVITDGQYMLGIDKDNFTFGRKGGIEVPNAITDWPEGWTAELLPDEENTLPKWIKLGDNGTTSLKCTTKGANTKYPDDFYGPLKITTDEYTEQEIETNKKANKKQPRYAKIKLSAGRMEWIITVKQLPTSKPLLRLLAAESDKDTEEYTGAYSANTYWNNWKIPVRETPMSKEYLFNLFALADASDQPREKPRYGVHATIGFNGNVPYNEPNHFDRRVVILQWGPEEAEAVRGSANTHGSGVPQPIGGEAKPTLYINALTSLDFEIKAFSSDPQLQIKGIKVHNLDLLNSEPAHHRYYDAMGYGREIKEWSDAAHTVVLLITAPGMEGNDDPFQSRYNELEFILDLKGTGVSRGEEVFSNEEVLKCTLSLSQQESSAIPYSDKEGNSSLIKWVAPDKSGTIRKGENIWRYVDAQQGMYLMNGAEMNFYVRANTPYRIELVEQTLDPALKGKIPEDGTVDLRDSTNPGLFISHFYGTPAGESTPPTYAPFRSSGKVLGEPVTFTAVDDTQTNLRKGGTAKFRIVSDHPIRKQFRDREFTVRFVSAIVQPEANSYMMLRGGQGIMIPVSRVNTAKKFYYTVLLSQEEPDPDNTGGRNIAIGARSSSEFIRRTQFKGLSHKETWYPEVIWADNTTNYEPPVKSDGTALLQEIRATGKGCDAYLYVAPGKDHVGNALVCIKNQRGEILWSWHIWVLEEYPQMISNPVKETQRKGLNRQKQYWMDRNIGAVERFSYRSEPAAYKAYGFLYQQGRKDPFPSVTSTVKGFFSDKDGLPFLFASVGNRSAINSTYLSAQTQAYASIPEMIANPPAPIYNEKEFLYERGQGQAARAGDGSYAHKAHFFIWGGNAYPSANADFNPFYGDDPGNANLNSWFTFKTPFDPCPYGWKVPGPGPESRWGQPMNPTGSDYEIHLWSLDPYFYTASYNKNGSAGEKTTYTQSTGTLDDVKSTFSIPGVIYDGAYDSDQTLGRGPKKFISMLPRYRDALGYSENVEIDSWRDFSSPAVGGAVATQTGYLLSGILSTKSNPLFVRARQRGLWRRVTGGTAAPDQRGKLGSFLNVGTFHSPGKLMGPAIAYPIRPVANIVNMSKGSPYASEKADGTLEVEFIGDGGQVRRVVLGVTIPGGAKRYERVTIDNWIFKDESDWTKYLPQRKVK